MDEKNVKNIEECGKSFRTMLVDALKDETDAKPTLTATEIDGKITVVVNPVVVDEILAKIAARKKKAAS